MKITGNLNNNISNKLIVDSSTQNFVNSNNVDDMDRVSNQDILNDKVLGNLFGAIGGEIGRFPISFAIGAFLLAGLIGLGPLGSIISGLGLTALEIIPDLTYFGGGIIAKLNKKMSDNQKVEEDKFDKIMKNIGKISMGKIVGATLGATLGYSIGKILNLFNVDLPYPKRLVEETRDFKLTKIIGNASNITHTSRKKITSDELKKIMKNLKPGDIIINEIEDYTFINLVATLKTGKVMQWGHAMIYLGDGKVMEARMETDSVTENDFVKSNTGYTHLIVIRPPEVLASKIVEKAKEYKDKVKYDFDYDLESDDAMYCSEFVYKVIKEVDKSVKINLRKELLGGKSVYPDELVEIPTMNDSWKVVYLSDDNNLWYNILSKYR